MNDNFAFNLGTWGLVLFAFISIGTVLLMFNSRINAYLKRHFILECLLDSLLWLSIWFIGNEFMKWWVSGIIALLLTVYIEKKAKIF